MKYTEQNAAAWDRWVEEGIEWGKPISGEAYSAAQRGEWSVLLTPSTPVPKAWFPRMRGARVLGLASAGGQQMPIFTALGAACTVLDLSDRQLESERMVAARERYAIDIVQADMTEPLPLESDSFDLIFHPVSNCYIRELQPVWDECFRVLRPGGVLLYATCSILRRENTAQVERFLADHPGFALEPLDARFGRDTGAGHQRLPGEAGMDGFFYARLRRI